MPFLCFGGGGRVPANCPPPPSASGVAFPASQRGLLGHKHPASIACSARGGRVWKVHAV